MRRDHIHPETILGGYDSVQLCRSTNVRTSLGKLSFQPNEAYGEYHKIHKVFVNDSTAATLAGIASRLEDETLPDAMNAAAWAYTEAAIVGSGSSESERLAWVERAEDIWIRSITTQDLINQSEDHSYLREDSGPYRSALAIAHVPLIEGLIRGNITNEALEHAFCDVLAIGQQAGVQRQLAFEAGDKPAANDFIGFEHEVNAILALLHMNDPRYICLPSSARAGSGTTYPDQTHDLIVINQHWGRLLDIAPVEVKAKASQNDIRRYKALIVRGKMHLASEGKHTPEHAREAFCAYYEGLASDEQTEMVEQIKATIKELLKLYRSGRRDDATSSVTRYHDKEQLMATRPELSFNRPTNYNSKLPTGASVMGA